MTGSRWRRGRNRTLRCLQERGNRSRRSGNRHLEVAIGTWWANVVEKNRSEGIKKHAVCTRREADDKKKTTMVSRNTWHQGRCTVAVDEVVVCLLMQGCGSVCFAQGISRVCSGSGVGAGRRAETRGMVAAEWTSRVGRRSETQTRVCTATEGRNGVCDGWCYMAGLNGRAPATRMGGEWMRKQDKA